MPTDSHSLNKNNDPQSSHNSYSKSSSNNRQQQPDLHNAILSNIAASQHHPHSHSHHQLAHIHPNYQFLPYVHGTTTTAAAGASNPTRTGATAVHQDQNGQFQSPVTSIDFQQIPSQNPFHQHQQDPHQPQQHQQDQHNRSMSHDNRIASDPVVNPYQFTHHQQSQPLLLLLVLLVLLVPDISHNHHLHQQQQQQQHNHHRVANQRATLSSSIPMAAMPPAATFTMNRQQPLSAANTNPATAALSSSLAQTAMPAPSIISGTMYHHQQPLAIETKKKRNVKEPSQSDLDLKILINNVDQFSLKDLASLIRQLEVDGGIIEKKSKLNDKKQNITKVAPIDGNADPQETKLDTQQFKQTLLSLPAAKRQQLFGTAWLKKACKVSNESHVPRNRIFAKYVTICADHGVPSLSPAPFGKLLRMIFPFITIHRYGVRGQSKYHYCGIQLIENESASEVASPLKSVFDGIDSAITSLTQSPLYSATQLSPASTVCSSFTGPSMLQLPPHASASSRSASASASAAAAAALTASFTDYCEDPGMKFTPNLLSQLETFGTSVNVEEELHLFLKLPSIEPFLPSSEPSNSDIAATLYSLYKSHCTSVFESLRYMKLKTLQKSLNLFQRSLTNPVFRLYTSESVMKWVQKSDIIMYQSILKMLGKLTLQEVPVHVLKQLKHISNVYPTLLAESLVNLPKRLCYLKLTSAKKFCNLMAKIVEISQLCAKIGGLIGSNSADANVAKALYHSWTDNVNATDIVLQEFTLHDNNAEILIKVLSHELPNLLLAEPGSDLTEKLPTSATPTTATKLEGLIFKWLSYTSTLPSRIHNISPKIFALLLNNLLDSALKSIFYIDEQSFVAWWSIKSWLIEWLNWYGELGGFLAMFENEHANEALMNSLASAGEELMRSTDTLESLMESTMMKGDVSANTTTTHTTNTDLGNFSSVNSHPDLTQNNDSSILSIHHNENNNNNNNGNNNNNNNINVEVNVPANSNSNIITSHHQNHNNGKNIENLNNIDSVNNINNHLGNPNGINITDEENQTEEIVPRSFNGDATTGSNNNANDSVNVSGDSNTNFNSNGNETANDDGKIPVDLLGGYFGPVDEKELMAFFS